MSEVQYFTRIKIENLKPVEFLLNSDLEAELHPGEDASLGVHSGEVVLFGHAHMWTPNARSQDNEDVDELIDILKGTYEEGTVHKHANVFINGGHHDYPDCCRVDGVYFIDPIGAIHKGYARVVVDPVNMRLDYIGRFNEKSYSGLELI